MFLQSSFIRSSITLIFKLAKLNCAERKFGVTHLWGRDILSNTNNYKQFLNYWIYKLLCSFLKFFYFSFFYLGEVFKCSWQNDFVEMVLVRTFSRLQVQQGNWCSYTPSSLSSLFQFDNTFWTIPFSSRFWLNTNTFKMKPFMRTLELKIWII